MYSIFCFGLIQEVTLKLYLSVTGLRTQRMHGHSSVVNFLLMFINMQTSLCNC